MIKKHFQLFYLLFVFIFLFLSRTPSVTYAAIIHHPIVVSIEQQTLVKYPDAQNLIQNALSNVNAKMASANIPRMWIIDHFAPTYDKNLQTNCSASNPLGKYLPNEFCNHAGTYVFMAVDETTGSNYSYQDKIPSVEWHGYNGLFSDQGYSVLAHELGHDLGLADEYWTDVLAVDNHVNGMEYPNPFQGYVMHNLTPGNFHPWDAEIINHSETSLPVSWNSWVKYQLPINLIQIVDQLGCPQPAQLRIFTSTPIFATHTSQIDATADYSGTTDINGIFSLGANILGTDPLAAEKVFLIEITASNQLTYSWLNFSDFNFAYWNNYPKQIIRIQSPNSSCTVPLSQIIVCPSGTAGQNGCNFIGGDGIQQAVDSAPKGNPNGKTEILIKNGNYTRAGYSDYIDSNNKKRKCFINTAEKYIRFIGEGSTVLDGANSANMSGICAKGGGFEADRLTLNGFKIDNSACFTNDTVNPCSRGNGIQLDNYAQSRIISCVITNNSSYPIGSVNYAESEITGNTIHNNGFGIALFNNSYSKITNNLIYNNNESGIYVAHQSTGEFDNNLFYQNLVAGISFHNSTSTIIIRNNIFAGNLKNTDGTFGYGMALVTGNTPLLTLNNNLYWNNATGCASDTGWCTMNESINGINPLFADATNYNFQLQPNSPAVNNGYISLIDPDASRSDIGAYGGPAACYLNNHLSGCDIFSLSGLKSTIVKYLTPLDNQFYPQDNKINLLDIVYLISRIF